MTNYHDQPRGTLTIVAPTTMMFSHRDATAMELYIDPVARSAAGYTTAILNALSGPRAADLRSVLLASGPNDKDLQCAVVAIATARGAELRAASADDMLAASEYAGWHGRPPSDHQLAAMIHHHRRCMADRGEPVGILLRAFDNDVFQSPSFGELVANVKV